MLFFPYKSRVYEPQKREDGRKSTIPQMIKGMVRESERFFPYHESLTRMYHSHDTKSSQIMLPLGIQ